MVNMLCFLFKGHFLIDWKVIRPSGTQKDAKLPVLIWIYGGGLYAGSSADPQYNISGITYVGQEINKPVIVGIVIEAFSFE